MKYTNLQFIILTVTLGIFISLINVEAKLIIVEENDSTVISNVQVEASSGREVIINGEVIESGDSEAKASVTTQVNGEVLVDIDEEASGDTANIRIDSKVKVEDDKAQVKTDIKNQEQETSQEYNINLNKDSSIEGEQSVEEESVVPQPIKVIWQAVKDFFTNLFSIFK